MDSNATAPEETAGPVAWDMARRAARRAMARTEWRGSVPADPSGLGMVPSVVRWRGEGRTVPPAFGFPFRLPIVGPEGHARSSITAPQQDAAMRTLLSQFCEAFDTTVRPLLTPISEANAALTEAKEDLGIPEVRAELLDLQHRIQGLVDKVAEQQAYVLLFGPLKSGKSTLMNALAGTFFRTFDLPK